MGWWRRDQIPHPLTTDLSVHQFVLYIDSSCFLHVSYLSYLLPPTCTFPRLTPISFLHVPLYCRLPVPYQYNSHLLSIGSPTCLLPVVLSAACLCLIQSNSRLLPTSPPTCLLPVLITAACLCLILSNSRLLPTGPPTTYMPHTCRPYCRLPVPYLV